MITSIPLSAANLGLGIPDYVAVAENIRRMKLIPLFQRKRKIEEAENKLEQDQIAFFNKLVIDMAYDKEVFKLAELNYSKGPPKKEGLFSSSLADYLLRRKLK